MERAKTTVARRYRLLEQLGRGGMGVVWRARDERLERDVAVKVLHPWVADDPDLRHRFEREASALARLEHPNVVRLYDVLESEGQTMLVMELVDGISLEATVARGPLGWGDARRYCAPVAAALAHAHARGVVHRDLTPANVLVERGTGRIVVTDFGLARLARSARSAPISGILAGTPEYWAPEQAAGGATGPATDLYALGCVLFRMLAGRVPFEGEDRLATGLRRAHEQAPALAAVAPGVPEDAARLVDRLLARDPALRGDAVGAATVLGAPPATLPGAHGAATDDRAGSTHGWPGTTLVTQVSRRTAAAERDAGAEATQGSSGATLVTRVFREPATIVRSVRSHRSLDRRRVVAFVAALVTAVAVTGGGVYAVAGGDPSGVGAPDVIGMRVPAARTAVTKSAREDGLRAPKVKVVDRSYNESAPAGAIVAQDPPEGERIPENGALLVSVSKGTAYADVPSVAGLEGAAAFALLERKGFTPSRRYAPSTEIEAWHALETDPAEGTRVERPARVVLVVSTGPPKRPIPRLDGLDAADAADAIRRAGFSPVVEERPETGVEAGTVLEVSPAPGSRAPLGSTVTIVAAREPRWEPAASVEGTEDARTEPLTVPAGARLVLTTADTSPLGLWGGKVAVTVSGDTEGSAELDAGQTMVLADASDKDRTIGVDVDVSGSAHWTLVVEVPR